MASDFAAGSSEKEQEQRKELQDRLHALQRERVAADRAKAQAEGKLRALESELSEHLQRRQRELESELEQLGAEATSDTTGEGGATARLADLSQRLETSAATQKHLQEQRDEKKEEERGLQRQHEDLKAYLAAERTRQQEEAKELDRLLSKKSLLLQKQEEFNDCIRKLGSLPSQSFEQSHSSTSSKQLLAEIELCHKELQKLGHVNKKALDQFANFSEQRDKLLERQTEIIAAEGKITELIDHLDDKKAEAIERTYKGISKHFAECFQELVPSGEGKMKMKFAEVAVGNTAASRIAAYSGVSLKVRFAGGGDVQTMEQLSGGQKTMVALVLIFAIQRCDPAPFYIFDEIDAALDATHRASLAKMIERQSMDVDESGKDRTPTQFITTTFRPELIRAGTNFYGVTQQNKVSTIKSIEMREALRIIAEDKSRTNQHVGGSQGSQ
mmetsp:Transcript_59381/g.132241  ORF Transcript_59381/g.132241 Transcript_59381/m.132241 type:complete len:443 (-) Transcript_59381:734-2062(-)